MKFVSQDWAPQTKVVDFHGVSLTVPEGTRWLTASSYGRVVAWGIEKPHLGSTVFHKHCFWDNDPYGEGWQEEIGRVDLEGKNWKDTLVELESW